MNCACWDSQSKSREFYATAVRSGNVAAIPEPEIYAMMLAGVGVLSLVARRRKKAG